MNTTRADVTLLPVCKVCNREKFEGRWWHVATQMSMQVEPNVLQKFTICPRCQQALADVVKGGV